MNHIILISCKVTFLVSDSDGSLDSDESYEDSDGEASFIIKNKVDIFGQCPRCKKNPLSNPELKAHKATYTIVTDFTDWCALLCGHAFCFMCCTDFLRRLIPKNGNGSVHGNKGPKCPMKVFAL